MSIEAIAATLAEVREEILAAHHEVQAARARVAEAIGILAELTRNHPESLVPPELAPAEQQMSSGLESMAAVLAAIERFQLAL